MTLEKALWGKPVEEKFYYGDLSKNSSNEITQRNLIQ
jgi:hypothetical protein